MNARRKMRVAPANLYDAPVSITIFITTPCSQSAIR
jgi:hypothetical protein